MASILTNYSAMTALQTLRGVNSNLGEAQARISTGLKVRSGKDNAAYFNISNTMRGDSGMYKSINEGLSLTKNSIATARAGAEQFVQVATEFVDRVAFSYGDAVDRTAIQEELAELSQRMLTIAQQATFNGDSLVGETGADAIDLDGTYDAASGDQRTVITGITRTAGDDSDAFGTTDLRFREVDLHGLQAAFAGLDVDVDDLTGLLEKAEAGLQVAVKFATSLGVAEKSIEVQQEFLSTLTDTIDGGIGGMIDADMEQEASRLQALQVQQQLATQSLSIANQNPQNILALFR